MPAESGLAPLARNNRAAGLVREGMAEQRVRDDYLAAAEVAVAFVGAPEVAARWDEPSALPRMTVGALACHLGGQVEFVARVLGDPAATEPEVSLLDYYHRHATWVGTGLDSATNLRIQRGEAVAAEAGPAAAATRANVVLEMVRIALPGAADRPVHLPVWGGWSLRLDDFVTSRMVELVVHTDDLAASLHGPTPELPAGAVDTVVTLLARLAVRRHGAVHVLRALSRAERAPATIAAI